MCPFVGDFQSGTGQGNGAADKVIRVLKMTWMLQTGCHTVEEMASQFAVSRRTIYRDLKLIDRAELPLETRQVGRAFHLVRIPGSPLNLPGPVRPWL